MATRGVQRGRHQASPPDYTLPRSRSGQNESPLGHSAGSARRGRRPAGPASGLRPMPPDKPYTSAGRGITVPSPIIIMAIAVGAFGISLGIYSILETLPSVGP